MHFQILQLHNYIQLFCVKLHSEVRLAIVRVSYENLTSVRIRQAVSSYETRTSSCRGRHGLNDTARNGHINLFDAYILTR